MASVAISLAIAGGSMALQYLFAPRVKQQPVDKGKLDDIRITSSDYGAFIPRIHGMGRVGGNLIWTSGITHTIINTPSGGGKGVPQAPAQRQHIYQTSVGILVARGELTRFLRIWADQDLLVNDREFTQGSLEAENATLGGSPTPTVETSGTYSGTGWVQATTGGTITVDLTFLADPTTPEPDPDFIPLPKTMISLFYQCSANRTADLTTTVDATPTTDADVPFTATGGEWTVKNHISTGFADELLIDTISGTIGFDYIEVQKYWEFESIPTVILGNKTTGVVNPDIIYPTDINDPGGYYNFPPTSAQDGTTKTYTLTTPIAPEVIRFYMGNTAQTQDSAMTAWADTKYGSGEGVLRIPAYRDLAYVVFQDRTLKQARIENFTFEVDNGAPDVNDVLTACFGDVNLTSGYYDISATSSLTQTGVLEYTAISRRQLIESLERYHGFRIAEIDGKIKTIVDSWSSIATIDADLIRAHNDDEEMPPYDAEVLIKEEGLMPREIRVSVMNPDIEYHNESVMAQLFASISSTESKEYAFPIVDTTANARTAAEKLLLKEHAEDKALEFYGMPELAQYSVGDVITVPVGAENIVCRIEKKQMALPLGKIRFQAVAVSPFTPTTYQTDVTTTAVKAGNLFASWMYPRNAVVIPIQSLPLTDKDQGLGVYLAVCGRGRGTSENFTLYREFDTDNFVVQDVIDTPAIAGLCEDTLATWGSGKGTEDTTSVLDIWFFDDVTLESVLQADIDRYPTINLLRVGDEWIQFRTATAQTLEDNSPYRSKWRITNMWRGRFNTDETASHSADEYAVLYTTAVKFYKLDKSDIGQSLTYKAVTSGQAEENALTTSFTFNPVASPLDHYADAATSGTASEVLYTSTIPIGTLGANGDTLEALYFGITSADANDKLGWVEIDGNDIGTGFQYALNNKTWNLRAVMVRVNKTTLRCTVESWDSAGNFDTMYSSVTVSDMEANDIDLELWGRSPSASGGITAKGGKVTVLRNN